MPLTMLHPPGWPAPRGYAHGVLGEGRMVLTGGQIGWDERGRFAEDFVAQVAQALRNVLAVVAHAGGGAEHIARLTWYVTHMPAYRAAVPALGPIYRDIMGRHYPAMALVAVTALVEPEALVEIEGTAILPAG